MRLITLLTDFGRTDYYVAAVKGVLLRAVPDLSLVDISHEVAPGDLQEGAFLLWAATRWLPPQAVHLAVVDPGVGSERRILAVEGPQGRFVGPDNGLLTPALPGARVVAVERPDLYGRNPGNTFHGRDRFAPVAAHWAAGGSFEELGEPIVDPVRLAQAPPQRETDRMTGRVVHIDRFGNLVTDLPSAWLDGEIRSASVGGKRAFRRVSHYAELDDGEVGVLIGSLGTLELSIRGRSLAQAWEIQRGAVVTVELGGPARHRQPRR